MASLLLGLPEIAETQNNKYITHNDGLARLEQSVNAFYTNTAATGTDITITEDDASFFYIYKFSGATANKFIIYPAQRNGVNRKRIFVITNNSLFTLTAKASTGVGPTVAVLAGHVAVIQQDFESMFEISSHKPGGGASAYDIGFFAPDSPTASDIVAIYTAPRQFELPDNFAGSVGFCHVNPTATAVFNVLRDATVIGTVSISTSGVFTFSTTASTVENFNSGQRLRLDAPSPADATLADISITFKGTRI